MLNIQSVVVMVACLLVAASSRAEEKISNFPTSPDIRFPVICTVENLASITPIAIVDGSRRLLFRIEKDNQNLDVVIMGGINDGRNHEAPFEGKYKLLHHSYYVRAEKISSYVGELSLNRNTDGSFGHGEKALILKSSYHAYSSVSAAAGICNEM